MMSTQTGVLQGSVLPFVIFSLCYINDLSWALKQLLLFADDTKVSSSVTDDDDINRMQQDSDNLVIWSEKCIVVTI